MFTLEATLEVGDDEGIDDDDGNEADCMMDCREEGWCCRMSSSRAVKTCIFLPPDKLFGELSFGTTKLI